MSTEPSEASEEPSAPQPPSSPPVSKHPTSTTSAIPIQQSRYAKAFRHGQVAQLPASIKIHARPADALVDHPVTIRIWDAPPNARVEVKASTVDRDGTGWSAQAVFTANERGEVFLDRDAPLEGHYSGVDEMGLLWSMTPDVPGLRSFGGLNYSVNVTASSDNGQGQVEVKRSIIRGVQQRRLDEGGLRGSLWAPRGAHGRPAVVLMGGSEGGMDVTRAALLARHGYAVLALAYLKYEGLPSQPVRLPVEYLLRGLDWLGSQDEVDPSRMAAVGASKGGEAALLLGTVSDKIRAVAATNTMTVLISASPGLNRAPWTYKGAELPYLRPGTKGRLRVLATGHRMARAAERTKGGLSQAAVTEAWLPDPTKWDAAQIPVDRVNGPILFISGAEDQMVPSAAMAETAMARLSTAGHPWPDRHLSFSDAGHVIGLPNVPVGPLMTPVPTPRLLRRLDKRLTKKTGPNYYNLGGSREGAARAARTAWHETLVFLTEALKTDPPARGQG